MELKKDNLQEVIFEYIDKIKVLIAPETWENVLLDCTKNELLIMLLLYRYGEVNMSQIAEYINVPLNTATGIVARMEKRELLCRERSQEDKRVMMVAFAAKGREQIQAIWSEFSYYGEVLMEDLAMDEIRLLQKVLDKMVDILQKGRPGKSASADKKIRKVLIE